MSLPRAAGLRLALAGVAPVLLAVALITGALPLVVATTARSADTAPGVAVLDAYLRLRAYGRLFDALQDVPRPIRVAWLQRRMLQGESGTLARVLARDLLADSHLLPPAEAQETRLIAAKVVLYAWAVMLIDGEACRDASSPGDIVHATRVEFRPLLEWLHEEPSATRRELVADVLALEAEMAPRRRDDLFLCRRGRISYSPCGSEPVSANCLRNIRTSSRYFLPADVAGPLRERMRLRVQEALDRFAGP
jgi:hypothetical protein